MNIKDKALIENPSFDRWLWLLKRTVQDNNWNSLHNRFKTDNSYFRELADILDYVNDEGNNVSNMHSVRQSVISNIGVFKVFREKFALDMFKSHTANSYDANLVISMFNRTVTFEENDKELLVVIKNSFNKRKSDKHPLVNTLDQAFQLSRVEGRPPNPYEVPNNIQLAIAMIIDEDMSRTRSIEKINVMANNHSLKTPGNKGLWRTAKNKPRPSIWEEKRWQDEMEKYKWAALNNYLHDRIEEDRLALDDRQVKRIKSNWNDIDIPNRLMIKMTYKRIDISENKAKKTGIEVNKRLH